MVGLHIEVKAIEIFGLGLRLILGRTSLSKARGALPFLVKGKEALSSVACQLFIQSNPPRSHILPRRSARHRLLSIAPSSANPTEFCYTGYLVCT